MTDQRINVQASFNDYFRSLLEFHLCDAFGDLQDNILKYFWCDGISEPAINEQFRSRNITSIKQIITKAWIGPDGNGRYDMIIKLGRCSRRRALRGLNLKECLPDGEFEDWVEIDTENCLITIQLN